MLPPYRVLDLSGPEAVFCGKLLADYGADVVRVEPPGGDPSRNRAPFAGDERGPNAACTSCSTTPINAQSPSI